MSPHYRRRALSRADELGALSVAILVGAGAATATYYVTRLLLSRDPIGPSPAEERIEASDRTPLPPSDGTPDPEG